MIFEIAMTTTILFKIKAYLTLFSPKAPLEGGYSHKFSEILGKN